MKNLIKGKRFNPKKFARRMLILLVVITISVFVFAPLVKEGEEGKKKIIVVKQGDTLWSIAARYYPDRDVRKAVYQLKPVEKGKQPEKCFASARPKVNSAGIS
ncbi:MAG: hypothetical protein PWQ31_1593 [Eubacteriales bacterium]|nr:hypothetical protein [Eubacteriales bacterium]